MQVSGIGQDVMDMMIEQMTESVPQLYGFLESTHQHSVAIFQDNGLQVKLTLGPVANTMSPASGWAYQAMRTIFEERVFKNTFFESLLPLDTPLLPGGPMKMKILYLRELYNRPDETTMITRIEGNPQALDEFRTRMKLIFETAASTLLQGVLQSRPAQSAAPSAPVHIPSAALLSSPEKSSAALRPGQFQTRGNPAYDLGVPPDDDQRNDFKSLSEIVKNKLYDGETADALIAYFEIPHDRVPTGDHLLAELRQNRRFWLVKVLEVKLVLEHLGKLSRAELEQFDEYHNSYLLRESVLSAASAQVNIQENIQEKADREFALRLQQEFNNERAPARVFEDNGDRFVNLGNPVILRQGGEYHQPVTYIFNHAQSAPPAAAPSLPPQPSVYLQRHDYGLPPTSPAYFSHRAKEFYTQIVAEINNRRSNSAISIRIDWDEIMAFREALEYLVYDAKKVHSYALPLGSYEFYIKVYANDSIPPYMDTHVHWLSVASPGSRAVLPPIH